jgi:hypothetical protein
MSAFSANPPPSIFDAAETTVSIGGEVDSLGGWMPIREQIVGVTEEILYMAVKGLRYVKQLPERKR